MVSGLEQEVAEGILTYPDPDNHCLLFTRAMNNVNSDHKNARDFVDLVDDDLVDTLAQRQLIDLVDQKLFEKLPAFNIFQYENLEWSDGDDGGITEREHGEYLTDLAQDFEGKLHKVLDFVFKSCYV